MRKFILGVTVLLVFFTALQPGAAGSGKRIILMPFYDESGYKGPWKLRNEMPAMLGDMLMDDYYQIVPVDSVIAFMEQPKKPGLFKKFIGLFANRKDRQKILTDGEVLSIARKLDGDIVVTGFIEDFSYRHVGGGEPMIGGYRSYSAKVKLDQVRILNVANGQLMGRAIVGETTKPDRGLGLELFGKERPRTKEFYGLDSLDFGSKGFLSSLMGQAAVEALNKVQKEVRAVITLPDTNWYSYKKFHILLVEQGIATINAGSGDGIKPGDRFRVYTSDSGVHVGKITVTTVWGDHISKAEITQGKDEIRQKDVIMPDI
ncbi:MAG: hypothetical protein ACYC9O_19185 [Candidatus Latescibacterota bacterium]